MLKIRCKLCKDPRVKWRHAKTGRLYLAQVTTNQDWQPHSHYCQELDLTIDEMLDELDC